MLYYATVVRSVCTIIYSFRILKNEILNELLYSYLIYYFCDFLLFSSKGIECVALKLKRNIVENTFLLIYALIPHSFIFIICCSFPVLFLSKIIFHCVLTNLSSKQVLQKSFLLNEILSTLFTLMISFKYSSQIGADT